MLHKPKTHSRNSGKTTYYVYDKDGQLIGEYDSSGIELKTYYRYGGDVIAQKRLQTASPSNWLFADSFEANSTPIGGGSTSVVTEYLHNDFLGTSVAATDSGGRVLWRSPRRAYGTVANRPSKSDYPVGYTGYYEDGESDLSYAGARYYANNVGRFYSPDPVTFRADNLFSFNRYAYGNNNPYKYVDPTGELAWFVIPIGVALYFGTADVAHAPTAPGDLHYPRATDRAIAFGAGAAAGAAVQAMGAKEVAQTAVETATGVELPVVSVKGAVKSIRKFGKFSPTKLERHFNKHKSEWGGNMLSASMYEKRAKKLLNSDIDGSVKGFTSKEGTVFRYNSRTNEFATGRPDGTIETLFRPRKGKDYWKSQRKKYSNKK